jgi:cobalt-zinc-cadmium efflux system membrane fusion protein
MNLRKLTKSNLHLVMLTIFLGTMLSIQSCSDNTEQAEAGHEEPSHEKGEHAEAGDKEEKGHEEGKEEGEEEGEGHEEEDAHIELSQAQIKQANIKIEQAVAGFISELLPVYGRITVDPDKSQMVVARFDGVIQSFNKKVGDHVRKNETLLSVEANDSFRKYDLTSSIDGQVTQRNGNVGEQTDGRTLLVVEDFTNVWLELSLFPKDLKSVHVGQRVIVKAGNSDSQAEGKLSYIAEFSQASTQSILARVVLSNDNREWFPGQFVNAQIAISETEAKVVIKNESIQIIEDKETIFVQGKEGYEPRQIKLGKTDGVYTEVLEGLQVGEFYVSLNSFVLKSELGKEDAEHSH